MISVIIPTLNAGTQLKSLLDAIKVQTVTPSEIIIIDSSSTDNTIEIANTFCTNIINISREAFDHGGTRNKAAKTSTNDILIYMTQDAMPANEYAIENLVRPIIEDNAIAASYGRQLPCPDASPFASHLRLFNYPNTPYYRKLADKNKYGIKTAFLSNSFAAYKRDALKEVGWFKDDLILGEDTYAGARLLVAGYTLAYEVEALIYHSHNYTIFREFQRYFDIGVFHKSEEWLIDKFGKAGGEGMKYIKSELSYIMNRHRYDLIPEFIIRNFLKLAGYKLGQNYSHIPPCLIEKLSMHKDWWNK